MSLSYSKLHRLTYSFSRRKICQGFIPIIKLEVTVKVILNFLAGSNRVGLFHCYLRGYIPFLVAWKPSGMAPAGQTVLHTCMYTIAQEHLCSTKSPLLSYFITVLYA